MKLERERLEPACRIPVGLAVLLAGGLLSMALIFVAFGQRYEVAGTSIPFGAYPIAYRLDKLTGVVAVCLTKPDVDSAGRLVRLSMDCSGRYR